jgi:exo-beta-1,3-glucanase (GH17 family)
MSRRYAPSAAALVAALTVGGLLAVPAPHAAAAKKKTTKATKATKAVKVPVTKPTIPLSKITLPADKKDGFCKAATETKAKLSDIKSKKIQLGTSTPSSLYRTEIEIDRVLEKAAPKELAPDFAVIRDYLGLFATFADTKDADKLATLSAEMSSDAILGRYFDATVRVEAFVRRTCGFPVGI